MRKALIKGLIFCVFVMGSCIMNPDDIEADCNCEHTCYCECEPCMITTEQGACLFAEMEPCITAGGDMFECMFSSFEICGGEQIQVVR